MSTTYGLHCQNCQNSIMPDDNMRKWDAESVLQQLPVLAALGCAWLDTSDVQITASWCDDMPSLMEWAMAHGDHTVKIIDEYEYIRLTYSTKPEDVRQWPGEDQP